MKTTNTTKIIYMLFAYLLLSNLTFAAGGLDGVNTIMEDIKDGLFQMGITIITIAIVWAGYKILFAGSAFRDIANILIGALLVGAASTIAAVLAPGAA